MGGLGYCNCVAMAIIAKLNAKPFESVVAGIKGVTCIFCVAY